MFGPLFPPVPAPEGVPPPFAPVALVAPPPVGAPVAVPVPVGEVPPEEAAGVALEPVPELAELLVAAAVVVVALAEVVFGLAVVTGEVATPVVGTVSDGAPVVLADCVEPPPQAASWVAAASAARSARRTAHRPSGAQDSNGSTRRPQCGQSLRSFWVS